MLTRSLAFIALALVACAGCARGGAQNAPGTTATASATYGNLARGADVFRANCAVCHAANGAAAGVGPPLAGERHRKTYDQTVAWIEEPDPPMPKLYPEPLSQQNVEDVAAYVQSL